MLFVKTARALGLALVAVCQAGAHSLDARTHHARFPETSTSEATLIPREVLFGPAAKIQPKLSPDGTKLAYLAPDRTGALNVWVETLGSNDASAVTNESRRRIDSFRWAEDGEHILYIQDSDGNEVWHVYSTHLATRTVHDLTPYRNVRASNLLTSSQHPNEILVALNLRDSRVQDMYRINLKSRAVRLDTANPGDVLSWTVDKHFVVRAATAFDTHSGKTIVRVREGANRPWNEVLSWPFEDSLMFGQAVGSTVIAGFSAEGNSLYVVSATHTDTGQLVEIDAQSGREIRVIARHPRSDVAADPDACPELRPLVMVDPVSTQVQAVAFQYAQWEWKLVDPSIASDWAALTKQLPGFVRVVSRDRADRKWIVAHVTDDRPQQFYLYERKTRQAQSLTDSTDLQRYVMARKKPIELTARDGQRLVSYLTMPVGAMPVSTIPVDTTPAGPDARPLPMVLIPHGGPWSRDDWGYDALVQFLANRGYVVLQVNFRGSAGFGKQFLNAGNHQLGLAMQDDLTDAVRWAVRENIADPKRVAILGVSVGGYATLRGLTRTPELYSCGVDAVGPSDLRTSLAAFPPWWKPVKARWIRRVGDVERDGQLNQSLSPLHEADRIKVPLMIAQGATDPRATIRNADLMVHSLRKRNRPVTYIVYPDEGHGFIRHANKLDFYGRVEVFFKHCLDGRAQPWQAVSGSTAQVY
jgi:dipeptidyl aminopeptidase/acylaminoacyl peptidase